jgi:hypothetical protein
MPRSPHVGREYRRSYPLESKLWLRRSVPFGVGLAIVIVIVWLTSNPDPVISLGPSGRFVVSILGMISLGGFAVTAGIAAGLYLLWRYGD